MEIKYIRKHNDSFMTIIDEANAVEYETKMIDSNDISILLEYSILEIDGTTQYNYNISRKENLQDYLETRDYSLEAIEKTVLSLQIGLSELEKYLIDEERNITLFIDIKEGITEEEILLNQAAIVKSIQGIDVKNICISLQNQDGEEITVATYTDASFYYYDE